MATVLAFGFLDVLYVEAGWDQQRLAQPGDVVLSGMYGYPCASKRVWASQLQGRLGRPCLVTRRRGIAQGTRLSCKEARAQVARVEPRVSNHLLSHSSVLDAGRTSRAALAGDQAR